MKKIIFSAILSTGCITCFSQSSLYITAGANVVVTAGTALVADGLSLKPAANYIIPGANSLTRDAVTVPGTPTPHIDRVYHFLANLPAFTGDITHYYTDPELNGLNENLLNLNLYDGTAWALYPATARDNVNNFVTTTGLTNVVFNEATLAESLLLPVTLTNVRAYQKSSGVQLEWRSEQELNIEKYEAERSATGSDFIKIGTVAARGNTGGTTDYSLFDPQPFAGVNFYRIKVSGQLGVSKYSVVMKVNIGKGAGMISVYPNPVTGNTLSLQINNLPAGTYSVTLTDVQGQRVSAKMITYNGGSAAETLMLPKLLAQGVYQVNVSGGGRNMTEQIIKR